MIEATSVETSTMKKLTKRIVPFVLLLYIVAVMDRVNIGFAALTMNADLGISPSTFGMLAGIFFVAYFFFEVPSNILMHKFGARRWIARILISWGLVTVAIAAAQNATHIGILRVLLGMAEAGFYPCIILYLTFFFPSRYFARTLSLFMIGQGLANIVVGPISTLILDHASWLGLASWRWLFVLQGVPAVILGFITLFVMVDRPEQAKFLTDEEKQWLTATLKAEYEAKMAKSKNKISNKWSVFKVGRVWHLALIYFCYVTALYGLGLWMPQVLRAMSAMMSNTQIGLLSTIPYICAVIVMNLVGRHSDKTGERRKHVGIPISFAFFSLIALTFSNNIWLSLALLAFSTSAIYCFIGTFWTLPTAFLGEATAAVGIALINSVGNLGGFAGPYLVGFMKDLTGSTNGGMYFLASTALLCCILVLALPKELEKVEVAHA